MHFSKKALLSVVEIEGIDIPVPREYNRSRNETGAYFMSKDLAYARQLLTDGDYTCVLCRGDIVYTSTKRGVAPLLGWLDTDTDLKDFSAADRVVGRATAYLYHLLGVKAVFARVMSRPAAQVLADCGIPASWDILVDAIENRQKTGPCPMEHATRNCVNAEEALKAIREALARLTSQSNLL